MSVISSTLLALQGVPHRYRPIGKVEQLALLVAERSEPRGAVALVQRQLVQSFDDMKRLALGASRRIERLPVLTYSLFRQL
jgi:hypothetical protein